MKHVVLTHPAIGAPVETVVRQRRSIRGFRPDPLPRRLVAQLLETACWAPSPHNAQPWRFTALFERLDRERLATAMAGRLEADLRAAGFPEEDVRRQSARSRTRISAAPVAVLCSLVRDGLVEYSDARMDELEWGMAVQSVGAVVQTLFLLAQSHGIGTCWMAAPMYCPDVVRSSLDLPGEYAPQALILMGYADRTGKIRPRRPTTEVIDLR